MRRALKSVLEQDCQDFELIIIDDGSNKGVDEYRSIEEAFQQESRIQFLHQENAGVSVARNYGISESKGRFVCFMDDDDFYLKNHLSVLKELIDRNDERVAFYRTLTYVEKVENEKIPQDFKAINSSTHPLEHIFNNLLTPNNVCVHRGLLSENRFNEGVISSEDYEMWVRLLIRYPYFEALEFTTVYDQTRETKSTPTDAVLFRRIKTMDIIFSDSKVVEVLGKKRVREIYRKYYSWLVDRYQKSGDLQAFRQLKEGIVKRIGREYFIKKRLAFLVRNIRAKE